MKTIIAYLLSLFLAPFVAFIVGMITGPVNILFQRDPDESPTAFAASFSGTLTVFEFAQGIAQGFPALWVSTHVFRWLDVAPSILLPILLSGAFLGNGLPRARRLLSAFQYRDAAGEGSNALGCVAGIVIAAWMFGL